MTDKTTDVLRMSMRQIVDMAPDAPALPSARERRIVPSPMLALVGGFVIVLVLGVSMVLLAARPGGQPGEIPFPPASSDTSITKESTPPVAVARMTVVFRPGELTQAEEDTFTSLLKTYKGAIGHVRVDEATAYQQASSLFADDADALEVLNEHPQIASGYAQIDFADTGDALALQEAAGRLDFVVAIVGSNGPRLGRGYVTSPELPLEDEDVRGAIWQYMYRSDLPSSADTQYLLTTTTLILPTDPTIADWYATASGVGGESVSDAHIVRAGADVGSLVPGSGFAFETSTQDEPAVDEMGIVMFLARDVVESDQIWTCISDYAIVNGERIGGGGQCTASDASEMLWFGLSGSGSCIPSPDVAPQLVSVWGIPDTATEIYFNIGDGERVSVPVTTSGTAQIVITGQIPVWSVDFDGITDDHRAVLDQLLPSNQNVGEVCGDAGGG